MRLHYGMQIGTTRRTRLANFPGREKQNCHLGRNSLIYHEQQTNQKRRQNIKGHQHIKSSKPCNAVKQRGRPSNQQTSKQSELCHDLISPNKKKTFNKQKHFQTNNLREVTVWSRRKRKNNKQKHQQTNNQREVTVWSRRIREVSMTACGRPQWHWLDPADTVSSSFSSRRSSSSSRPSSGSRWWWWWSSWRRWWHWLPSVPFSWRWNGMEGESRGGGGGLGMLLVLYSCAS